MTASVDTGDREQLEGLSEFGLDGEFAYEITNCAEVGTHDGGIEKIVQLRNSWTHFQWNGDWSAKSPCWTDVARKQVKLSPDPNTDTFWMAF